jgi:dihydroorotate dehydrogenase electron transfer subunit
MIQSTATLLGRETHGASQPVAATHELRLQAPELARQLAPGQAVLVRGGWGADPYLRRTFYPSGIAGETWSFRLPPSGDWAHAWLRAAPPGTALDCLGPVGNGFSIPVGARNALFVGEGELSWALLPALLRADAAGLAVTFAAEATFSRDLIPAGRLPAGVEYRAAALDAAGRGRLALGELLAWADVLLAAGTPDLYARLARAIEEARFRLAPGFAQALYPATFLCGYGACQACVADVAGGRRRVCQRGPVFDLRDLIHGG